MYEEIVGINALNYFQFCLNRVCEFQQLLGTKSPAFVLLFKSTRWFTWFYYKLKFKQSKHVLENKDQVVRIILVPRKSNQQ